MEFDLQLLGLGLEPDFGLVGLGEDFDFPALNFGLDDDGRHLGGLIAFGALTFGDFLGRITFAQGLGAGDLFRGGGQPQRFGLALAAGGDGLGDLHRRKVFALDRGRLGLRHLDALLLVGFGGTDVAVPLALARP